jgi:hypothetical protein
MTWSETFIFCWKGVLYPHCHLYRTYMYVSDQVIYIVHTSLIRSFISYIRLWSGHLYRTYGSHIWIILLKLTGWSWSCGSWIYNYLFNTSPLTLWVRIPLRRSVLNTILCDKVCQWLAAVGGFLQVLRFPPPIKHWPPRYNWKSTPWASIILSKYYAGFQGFTSFKPVNTHFIFCWKGVLYPHCHLYRTYTGTPVSSTNKTLTSTI